LVEEKWVEAWKIVKKMKLGSVNETVPRQGGENFQILRFQDDG
jgi:hypothetical protein